MSKFKIQLKTYNLYVFGKSLVWMENPWLNLVSEPTTTKSSPAIAKQVL